jgi:predicted XRE-type DNA-binding protein
VGDICVALFPEEVSDGHSDAESGCGTRFQGNVFADLGLADAGERQTRVRLAVAINEVLRRRGVSQGRAAELLGINQPKISALSKYRLDGFSVERLMRFLTLLNQDVEIIIRNRPRARRPGRVSVTAA